MVEVIKLKSDRRYGVSRDKNITCVTDTSIDISKHNLFVWKYSRYGYLIIDGPVSQAMMNYCLKPVIIIIK